MLGSLKVKVFAGLVLRDGSRADRERIRANRPATPERRRAAGLEPDSPTLEAAERYLEREGYIVAPDPVAGGGSYKITEAGWEDLRY